MQDSQPSKEGTGNQNFLIFNIEIQDWIALSTKAVPLNRYKDSWYFYHTDATYLISIDLLELLGTTCVDFHSYRKLCLQWNLSWFTDHKRHISYFSLIWSILSSTTCTPIYLFFFKNPKNKISASKPTFKDLALTQISQRNFR